MDETNSGKDGSKKSTTTMIPQNLNEMIDERKIAETYLDTEDQAGLESQFSRDFDIYMPENKKVNWFIDRTKYLWTRVVPIAVISAVGLTAGISMLTAGARKIARAEKAVEERVEIAYESRQHLLDTIDRLAPDARDRSQPNAENLSTLLINSENALKTTDNFLSMYCDNRGEADDKVTKHNYEAVMDELGPIVRTLDGVNAYLMTADGIVKERAFLKQVKRSLDTTIEEIRNLDGPNVLANKAESTYRTGVMNVERGNLDKGQNALRNLQGLGDNIEDIIDLGPQLDNVYKNIKNLSKVAAANNSNEQLYANGKLHLNQGKQPS